MVSRLLNLMKLQVSWALGGDKTGYQAGSLSSSWPCVTEKKLREHFNLKVSEENHGLAQSWESPAITLCRLLSHNHIAGRDSKSEVGWCNSIPRPMKHSNSFDSFPTFTSDRLPAWLNNSKNWVCSWKKRRNLRSSKRKTDEQHSCQAHICRNANWHRSPDCKCEKRLKLPL